MISELQWQAFELVQQRRLTLRKASKEMRVEREVVVRLLKSLKEAEPILFPVEVERRRMGQQLKGVTMIPYSPILDEEVRHQY